MRYSNTIGCNDIVAEEGNGEYEVRIGIRRAFSIRDIVARAVNAR